jgi:hypothetical protein
MPLEHFMQAFSGPLLFKAHLGRGHGNIFQPVQTRIVEGTWLRHYVGRKICQGNNELN